jgi:hypothetical protein
MRDQLPVTKADGAEYSKNLGQWLRSGHYSRKGF